MGAGGGHLGQEDGEEGVCVQREGLHGMDENRGASLDGAAGDFPCARAPLNFHHQTWSHYVLSVESFQSQ